MYRQHRLGFALQDSLRAVQRLVDRRHGNPSTMLDTQNVGDPLASTSSNNRRPQMTVIRQPCAQVRDEPLQRIRVDDARRPGWHTPLSEVRTVLRSRSR